MEKTKEKSILLTSDDEHWYTDIIEPLPSKYNKNAMTLQFSKKNVEIDITEEKIYIKIVNANCDIYKILSDLTDKLLSY
jgi:hypothetical protein